MHIEFENNKHVAICDSLVDKDKKPIKIPLENQSQVESVTEAARLGELIAKQFLHIAESKDY